MVKIVFIASDGQIHTEGWLGYIQDDDLENPEPGTKLHELDAILRFVQDSFAPDYWIIEDGRVVRASYT